MPLRGVQVVNLGLNVPAPVAAARLAALGARIVKVEPPTGDPLEEYAGRWYRRLRSGQRRLRLDLHTQRGQDALHLQLSHANVLITSQRPSALTRLRLDQRRLRRTYPRLVHVAILGDHRRPDEAGHDLTYLAAEGLLRPKKLPLTLIADLAGAERTVSAVLLGLLTRDTRHGVRYAGVSLAAVARDLAAPLRAGLTSASGILGGGFAGYGVYRSADGWIALAALEPRFRRGVLDALNIRTLTSAALTRSFRTRDSAAWETWARAHDLPLRRLHPRTAGSPR